MDRLNRDSSLQPYLKSINLLLLKANSTVYRLNVYFFTGNYKLVAFASEIYGRGLPRRFPLVDQLEALQLPQCQVFIRGAHGDVTAAVREGQARSGREVRSITVLGFCSAKTKIYLK